MSGTHLQTVEVHDLAAVRLRGLGQRYTGGRRSVVAVLVGARRPLTIPEVLAADAGLSQSSVYRNLAVLEEAGVVRRVVSADEFARYELDEGLTGHHHHLICTSCGAVDDITIPDGIERTLDRAVARIEADTGFVTEQHRLDLLGRCAACA